MLTTDRYWLSIAGATLLATVTAFVCHQAFPAEWANVVPTMFVKGVIGVGVVFTGAMLGMTATLAARIVLCIVCAVLAGAVVHSLL